MADKSKIEWTDTTWNPVTGCSKVSQGCKNCYAERDWARLAAPRPKPNIYTGRDFTDVRCHPERLDQPLRWTKPRRIFVNSMSDLFHEDVPNDFIFDIFSVMERAKHHIFQVLTKRPERMLDLLGGPVEAGEQGPPRNIWWGVSVEDQATADQRIPLLLQTPTAVRWISAEPLLGPLNISRCLADGPYFAGLETAGAYNPQPLDWVVAGGESGPQARPSHTDWFRSIRDQCQAAGVPFFFKQWGNWLGAMQVGNPDHQPFIVNTTYRPLLTTKRAAGRLLDDRTWDEYPP